MALHARLSASQTKEWGNCAGQLAAKEAFPEPDPPGEFARMGTCAHGVIERCLGEGSEPWDYHGRLVQIVNEGQDDEGVSILKKGARMPKGPAKRELTFEVDDDMAEATTKMTDYVRLRCEDLGLLRDGEDRAAGVKRLVEEGVVRLETRVNPLPHRDDTGGTADVTIDRWPDFLEVVDYKNGSGVFVPVERNPQLRTYSAGALLYQSGATELSREAFSAMGYESVRYTIVQPRHRQAPPSGVSPEEMTVEQLADWVVDWLDPAAARVDEAREAAQVYLKHVDEPTVEGLVAHLDHEDFLSTGEDGSHCTWCPYKTRCPAAARTVQVLAQADFADEPEAIEIPKDGGSLADVLRWVPFVDSWVKACAGQAERMLMAGEEVPGYKLVRGASTRRWRETITVQNDQLEDEEVELTPDRIAQLLEEEFGLEGAGQAIWTTPEPSLLTGPQAEKLFKGRGSGEMKKRFNERFLHKPPGGLTMTTEDDNRPAVRANEAGDDFEGLDD